MDSFFLRVDSHLSNPMGESGFEDVSYQNLSGGVVALHVGFRY